MSAAFTIVIPTHGAAAPFDSLLRALTRLERPRGGFEVVIVDDGSSDRIEEIVARRASELPIRVLEKRGFTGAARCRELGLQAAFGEVVVFLDADMRVAPGWLVAYERALAAGADVVSGARWWLDRASAEGEREDDLLARAKPGAHAGRIFGAIERELDRWCQREIQGVLVALAAQASNLAVRRRVLDRTTGFNTCLRRFDDVELGIRLWEVGARFSYSADAYALRCIEPDAADGWLDDDEFQALFQRHPYADILRLHVWARRRQVPETRDTTLAWVDQPVDSPELHRKLGALGPGLHEWTESRLVEHFEKVDGLSHAFVTATVEAAIARGLYHEVRDGQRFFKKERLEFWMFDTTPFLQKVYQNDLVHALFQPDPDLGPPTTLSARARVHVEFDRAALRAAGVERLNIALPMERSGQHSVEITGASTPALLEAARRGSGMLVGFPASDAIGSDDSMSLEFSFQVPSRLTGTHDDAKLATQLNCALPPAFRTRAERVLRELGAGPDKDPVVIAHAIYDWLHDNVLFGIMPPQFPYFRILDFGVGNCIQQTRLFIALCRLAGIPAREVSGCLLHAGGEHKPEVTKQVISRGNGPWIHSWAEFHTPDRGWVAVEVQGFGRKGFTPAAMPEPDLRREVERVLYQRYPFGNLHPFRIVTGPQANRLSSLAVPPDADPAAARAAHDGTLHRVSCTFTRVHTTT